MTSKHDQHTEHILHRLSVGASRAQVARELGVIGVKTSGQEIYLWLKRRASRIVSNRALVDPLAASPAPAIEPEPALVTSTSKLDSPTDQKHPDKDKTIQVSLSDPGAMFKKGRMKIPDITEEKLKKMSKKPFGDFSDKC